MIWKPHTTVAAIIERDNQFLMVKERVDGKLVFNQPAGHLEPDESLIDAVIRETREETAWLFEPEALVGVYLWKNTEQSNPDEDTFLRFAFCGNCSDFKDDSTLDDDIVSTPWLSKDELIKESERLRSPLVMRCIDDYLAGIRFPLSVAHHIT